jgi:hypothetical protein
MQPIRQNKRKGRQLLVAAVGIASVSYVGTIQGCADVDSSDAQNDGAESASESAPEDVAQSQQALTISNTAINTSVNAALLKRLPPSGNLMPGPAVTTAIGGISGAVIKVPIPVGNLMVTPVDEIKAVDVAALENAVVEQP